VLDADVLAADSREIGSIAVLQTYVDGRLVHAR
jgi:predicted amidohydrolase YtcJ